MLSKERSLQIDYEWNRRMREFRAGSNLGEDYKKLQVSKRKDSIEHLRQFQTGGFRKRLELRSVALFANMAKLLRLGKPSKGG